MLPRRRLWVALCCLVATFAIPVWASAPRLQFDPAKFEPGTVLHYVKSNRDGSQAWRVDVRLVGGTRLEVIKYLEGAQDFVQVEVDIDPVRGHLAHALQHNWTREAVQATMSAALSADGKTMVVKLGNGQSFPLGLTDAPFHFYGFDFLGIGFLLPHLVDPSQAFEVDFVDPNRPAAEGAALPFFFARARFEPAGLETVHGKSCRKYLLKGPFFQGFEGALWADAVSGRLEKVESSLRTSVDWDKDFRLELQGVEQIDDFAWEAHLRKIQTSLVASAP